MKALAMHRPCAMRSNAKIVRLGAEASRVVGMASRARLSQTPLRRSSRCAEAADEQAGDRHADRAGIGGDADLRRRHAIEARERGQDRLGREQIDEGQEADRADGQRTAQRAGRNMFVHRGRRGRGEIGHGLPLRKGGAALRKGRDGAPHELLTSGGRTRQRGFESQSRALTSADSSTAGTLPLLTQ